VAGCQLACAQVFSWGKMTESAFINELIEEDRLNTFREALRQVIKGRFPTAVTPDVERAIADQPSLALLEDWLDAACTAQTGEEVLAVLRR
jgi:hypothetical protein